MENKGKPWETHSGWIRMGLQLLFRKGKIWYIQQWLQEIQNTNKNIKHLLGTRDQAKLFYTIKKTNIFFTIVTQGSHYQLDFLKEPTDILNNLPKDTQLVGSKIRVRSLVCLTSEPTWISGKSAFPEYCVILIFSGLSDHPMESLDCITYCLKVLSYRPTPCPLNPIQILLPSVSQHQLDCLSILVCF